MTTIKQTCACGASLEVSGSSHDVGWRQSDFIKAHAGHGGNETPVKPPIPSSAQLIREWPEYSEMETARAYSLCACGHRYEKHLNEDWQPSKCYGLHDDKPCVCPRFNG